MSEPQRMIDYGSKGVVVVVPSPEQLAKRAADTFLSIVESAVYGNGHGYVALSGGSTPKAMGQLLAKRPYSNRVQWGRLHFFWGDERWVPLTSDESNAGVAKRTFLDQVSIPDGRVHPFGTTELEPDVSAAQIEAKIRAILPSSDFPPRFDLILLGMGDDGHTASLFPGTRAIQESEKLVVANEVPKLDAVRLTFTPPLINAARNIIFLISGANKADTLKRVLEGEHQPDLLPSQVVQPDQGTLTWLVDESAASQLTGTRVS
jgi:6-phosphogluconolactonase